MTSGALQHFGEMDRLYEAACEVEGAIEESVAAEQYAEAARLRGVHADIQERDDVNTVLKVSTLETTSVAAALCCQRFQLSALHVEHS